MQLHTYRSVQHRIEKLVSQIISRRHCDRGESAQVWLTSQLALARHATRSTHTQSYYFFTETSATFRIHTRSAYSHYSCHCWLQKQPQIIEHKNTIQKVILWGGTDSVPKGTLSMQLHYKPIRWLHNYTRTDQHINHAEIHNMCYF